MLHAATVVPSLDPLIDLDQTPQQALTPLKALKSTSKPQGSIARFVAAAPPLSEAQLKRMGALSSRRGALSRARLYLLTYALGHQLSREGQIHMNIMNFGDDQLKADVDFAGKKYAADVVGELLKNDPTLTGAQIHAVLLERAEAARTR